MTGGNPGGPSAEDVIRVLADLAPGNEIRPDSDLIRLGVDSLRMMRAAGHWRRAGFDVSFADLLDDPTPEAWARIIAAGAPGSDDGGRSRPAGPSSPADGPDGFPLAPLQHAYWAGGMEGTMGGVGAHLHAELDGPDHDPDLLDDAARLLFQRHPMLRAEILPDGTQRIRPEPPSPAIRVEDLRNGDPEARARRLDAIRSRMSGESPYRDHGRMLDIVLSRLPGERARLHVNFDMLAGDAMSYRIILADLSRLLAGEEPPPIRTTFREYLTHPTLVEPPHRDADRDWWRSRLGGLPAPIELPGTGTMSRRGRRMDHRLDAGRRARLEEHARRNGVTPAAALATAFAAAIGGFTDQSRFLINVPLFHREPVHEDIDQVVGDFSSTVLVEVENDPARAALARIRGLSASLAAASRHAGYSALDVLRDLSREAGNPVFAPVVYTSAVGLGELFPDPVRRTFGDPVWIISQGPQVTLDAQITELDGGFLANWDIRDGAFPDGVPEAMFEAYRRNIGLLVDSPDWDSPFPCEVPARQRAARAATLSTSDVKARGLHEDFFRNAGDRAGVPAVLWGRDGVRDHATLSREARSLAATLRGHGIGSGDAVGIRMRKGPNQVTAVLGVLAAGAAWVPIGMDQPPARIAAILGTAGAGTVIQDHDAPVDGATVIDFADALTAVPLDTIAVPRNPREDPAYILFTSGSTGEPKGVEVPHAAVRHTIEVVNGITGIGPDDRTLALSSLEFDLSIQDIFAPLGVGGAVVTMDAEARHDAETWADLIRDRGVTHLYLVPPLLDMLLGADTGDSLRGLRWCLLGGDWVTVDLPGRLRDRAPHCRFAGLGGATETPIHSTFHEVRTPSEVRDEWRAIPFGTPLPDMRTRIAGPGGGDQPDHVPGELWIAGPGLASGYRGDPELTATRFPTLDGIRWYRTGDRARYLPGGIIEFLGRIDDQVKIRGYRIETGEVAAALRALPGIRAACVLPRHGAGAQLGAVVEAPGDAPSAERLRDDLAAVLPGYMIPDRIVVVPSLPLTGNGKVDRRACAALVSSAGAGHDGARPSDALEELICAVFARVLGPGVRDVGADADFIALGGDSVLMTRTMSILREELDQRDLPVAPIFSHRSPHALASALRAAEPEPGILDRTAEILAELDREAE